MLLPVFTFFHFSFIFVDMASSPMRILNITNTHIWQGGSPPFMTIASASVNTHSQSSAQGKLQVTNMTNLQVRSFLLQLLQLYNDKS